MRRPSVLVFALPLGLAITACGAPPEDHDDRRTYGSSVELASPDGGTPADGSAATSSVDFSEVPSHVVQNESQGALAISGLATLIQSFLPVGRGMDASASPASNAARIVANLQAACAAATITSGAAYLTVDFGSGCQLADTGLIASGVVQVGVTGDGSSVASAAMQIKGVAVSGYTIDGFANVWNTTTSLSIATRVAIAGLGTMSFNGASTATGGSAYALTGTGVFTGSKYSTPTNDDGVSCTSSRQSFIGFRQMRRAVSRCFPEAGKLEVRTAYVCRRAAGAADSGFTTTISTSSLAFDVDTPRSGEATVSVTTPGADDGPPDVTSLGLTAAACP